MTAPAAPDATSRLWKIVFTSLMSGVMAVAVFSSAVLGIISKFLIEDLEITRTQLGWLAGAVSITAALSSPYAGQIADRIGGRKMAITVFAMSGLGLLAMSASPTYVLLLAAGLVAGLAQAGANPSTNKLISHHVAAGRRGLITGVKQSGVQAGLVLGGLIIPSLAIAYGWRTALALVVIVPAGGALIALLIVPQDDTSSVTDRGIASEETPIPTAIQWIAGQGVLVGVAAAVFVTYLPLYVEEELGLSVKTAGAVVAVYGLAGLLARLALPTLGERMRHLAQPMLIVAGIAMVGTVMIWLGGALGAALVWAGAALAGVQVAWTALGMLAVITQVEQHHAGRASGIVSRGFGIGLAAGPPIFGFTVDTTGAYHLGFVFLLVVMLGSAVLMTLWLKSESTQEPAGL